MINFLRGETSRSTGLFILRFAFGYQFLSYVYALIINIPLNEGFMTTYFAIGLALFSIVGILMLLGLGTRIIALISFLYFQAFQFFGYGVTMWSFPLTLLFLVPVFLGSGKYSLDYLIARKRQAKIPAAAI